jgi:hypothetical protein
MSLEHHYSCDNPDCKMGCKHTHPEKCGHDLCCGCIVRVNGKRFCIICLKKAFLDEGELKEDEIEDVED